MTITGTFDGQTQGDGGDFIDFSGDNGTKTTKEGVILYPIDSEFGFYVTDFVGAEDKELDGDYKPKVFNAAPCTDCWEARFADIDTP